MTDEPIAGAGEGKESLKDQFTRAARDLWTPLEEAGDEYAIFMDRRRLRTRMQRDAGGRFHVSWDDGEGAWSEFGRTFDQLREAAFHAYQGPHPE